MTANNLDLYNLLLGALMMLPLFAITLVAVRLMDKLGRRQ